MVRYADILQVGARNMQNFVLLDEVGQANKPVMLKRGISATIQEWLLAAEYILAQGDRQVMLCERGIRTFETYTRNTMDVSAIPIIHKESHLPIIADPSHGTGKWDLVMPMALASVAAGADGLMIEVHPTPDTALKDGAQSLTFDHFEELMKRVGPVAEAVGRTMAKSRRKRMKVEEELKEFTPQRDTVLTIGVFDGVHIGHQRLMEYLKRQAMAEDRLPGVVTFRSHPQHIMSPKTPLYRLITLDERIRMIKEMGIELVVPLSFNLELAQVPARDFIALLQKHLRMRGLAIGPDFALGKGREGDA